MVSVCVGRAIAIQSLGLVSGGCEGSDIQQTYRAHCLQCSHETISLVAVGRILSRLALISSRGVNHRTNLPVDIQPIKPEVLHQIDSRRRKLLSTRISAQRASKVARVSPASNREEDLEIPVLLLQQEELLDASIHVVADIVPRVAGEVLLDVRPGIGQVHLARVCFDVGKRVQHMRQPLDGKLVGDVVAAVDSLHQFLSQLCRLTW